MGKLLDLMVRRSVPPNLLDPEQERIAAEAAENGIRSTVWLALIVPSVLVLGVLAIFLARNTSAPQASSPVSTASQTARVLSSENAELRLDTEALQKKLDEVTKEREELYGRVADLQTQVGGSSAQEAGRAQPGTPSGPAGAGAPPQPQPVDEQTAPKPSRLAEQQPASKPAQTQPVVEQSSPKATVPVEHDTSPKSSPSAEQQPSQKPAQTAAEHQPVKRPARTSPTKLAAVPRSAAVQEAAAPPIAPPSVPSYLCRDGRTVHDASQCENSPSDTATSTGPQQLASVPAATGSARFVVEFRQEESVGPALPGQSVVVNFYDTQRNVISSTGWVTNGTGRTPVFTVPSGTAYFQVVGPGDVQYSWPTTGNVLEVNPANVNPGKGLVVVRFLTR